MLIDGKKIAEEIKAKIKEKMAKLETKLRLALLAVNPDLITKRFMELKKRFGDNIGVEVKIFVFEEISKNDFSNKVKEISDEFDGLVIQLPLSKELMSVLDEIPEGKDVDGLGRISRRKLASGKQKILPGVVGAIDLIFKRFNVDLKNKKIALVGQGFLVGAPLRLWLQSQNIEPIVFDAGDDLNKLKEADIIISGVGKPRIIKPEMIKEDAVLIDVGASEVNGELLGDIDPACFQRAKIGASTPGGIGPITVATLFYNLLILYGLYEH